MKKLFQLSEGEAFKAVMDDKLVAGNQRAIEYCKDFTKKIM